MILPWLWIALWFGTAALFSGGELPFRFERILGAPEPAHILGFDAYGRDALRVLLNASVLSGAFAFAAVTFALGAGLFIGISAALSGPGIRAWTLRGIDLLLAFPSLLLALGWAAIFGPGWDTLLIALLIGILPSFSRLVYARAREVLVDEYILAARGLGQGELRIALKHLLPALLSFAGIKAPGLFAHCLLAEATLSFLGIGVPIGRDSWGSLLAQAKDYLLEAPHLAFAAGIPLVLTAVSLQFISEFQTGKHFRV